MSRELVGDRRRLTQLGGTAATVLAALLLGWGPGAAFFLGLLAISVSGLVDGRLSVAAGLVCLACCPVLLIAEQGAWLQQSVLVNYYAASVGLYSLKGAADVVAVWAYYFLCIGVAAQIVRYIAQGKRRESA